MSKWMGLLLWLIFISVYASSFDVVDSGAELESKENKRIFHLFQGIDLISAIDLKYDRPRIVMKAVYPVLTPEEENEAIPAFNQRIQEILAEELAHFKTQVNNSKSMQQTFPKNKIKNDLYMDYATSVITAGKNYIASIRFAVQGFITGVNGAYRYHRVVNFDLAKNQEIILGDLFEPDSNYLEIISQYAREKLLKRFKNKAMVLTGTEPNANNFRNWNIKPNGILITFDQYQVAPSIQGAISVLIPYSALKSVLTTQSPIGACIKQRKKCQRNNVVTGGFIDEVFLKTKQAVILHS